MKSFWKNFKQNQLYILRSLLLCFQIVVFGWPLVQNCWTFVTRLRLVKLNELIQNTFCATWNSSTGSNYGHRCFWYLDQSPWIEHILRNKIIKSFNYFSHRLTGIALMLSISLKLTNGMLRITLIGSSQRTAFLNFVAGCKVFPQAVQRVDYFWGFLFLAFFQTKSENLWADTMDLSLEHI